MFLGCSPCCESCKCSNIYRYATRVELSIRADDYLINRIYRRNFGPENQFLYNLFNQLPCNDGTLYGKNTTFAVAAHWKGSLINGTWSLDKVASTASSTTWQTHFGDDESCPMQAEVILRCAERTNALISTISLSLRRTQSRERCDSAQLFSTQDFSCSSSAEDADGGFFNIYCAENFAENLPVILGPTAQLLVVARAPLWRPPKSPDEQSGDPFSLISEVSSGSVISPDVDRFAWMPVYVDALSAFID
jgi:hypothetical protein